MQLRTRLALSRLQRGLSLVELMVAMTLSLFIIGGLAAVFVGNSRSRAEIDRANQQIENGRYALQSLTDDIQLAGYLSQLDVKAANITTPSTAPNPCDTTLAGLNASLSVHVQPYDNTDGGLTCLGTGASPVPDTDIIVVRRASSCIRGGTDCPVVSGAPYFQASLCNSSTELSDANTANRYRLDTNIANLDRHKRDCTAIAEMRQYLTRIYFVDDHNNVGDGIPTLKRADLDLTVLEGFTTVAIAEGIENLQLEYGIDNTLDGTADAFTADPNIYNSVAPIPPAPAVACTGVDCVTNLLNIVSIKVHILARNTTPSVGYKDTKTYSLGLDADGDEVDVPAANDAFRRHVYSNVVKVMNAAGRREE